jgi:hypothetical protein
MNQQLIERLAELLALSTMTLATVDTGGSHRAGIFRCG